jgi:sec-independent protein translocase protein TatC
MVALPTFLRRRAKNPDGRMAVLDHLRELRRRLIIALIFIALGAVAGWFLYIPVLKFLEHPYCNVPAKYRLQTGPNGHCTLVYTGVLDGFNIRLKVSVIVGTIFSAPFWLYQIWAFITPGLRKNERRYTVAFIAISTVLFAVGMTLAYLLVDKGGLTTLLSVSGSGTTAFFTVTSYLSFITLLLVVFGSAFELPVLVVMANLAGALPARLLRRTRRIAIFLIFVFAAVATPTTDPFTMTAMAVPMVILYEGAILFAIVHDRRKAARKLAAAGGSAIDDDQPSSIDPLPPALPAGEQPWSDTT